MRTIKELRDTGKKIYFYTPYTSYTTLHNPSHRIDLVRTKKTISKRGASYTLSSLKYLKSFKSSNQTWISLRSVMRVMYPSPNSS